MRRTALALVLTAALLLAACSKNPAPPADDPVSVPPVTESPSESEEPTTSSGWNDRSLILIREKKWDEAIVAAQAALKLDPGNSAAYFNFGRALLGAEKPHEAVSAFQQASRLTNEGNADVEWFLGQALALSGNETQAVAVYERALATFPEDQEIRAALQELRQKPPEAAGKEYQADVDLDGVKDRIIVAEGTATVRTEQGAWSVKLGPSAELIKVYHVPDGPPLLIFAMSGCNAYSDHAYLRWDPSTRMVQRYKGDTPCSIWGFRDDGTVSVTYRSFPWVSTFSMRWQGGGFTGYGEADTSLMGNELVNAENVSWVLSELLSGRAKGLNMLFPSDDEYRRFTAKAPEGLAAGEEEQADPGTVRVPLLADGQVKAVVTFSEAEHLITNVEWK